MNKIVTICGSLKFTKEMIDVSLKLQIEKGYIVIQPCYNFNDISLNEKDIQTVNKIHKQKIDISDAIYVLNINGYIGNSVKSEIEYAKAHNKEIIYHTPIK